MLVDEVRMTGNAMRYGFAVGKVRVLETRTLDRSALERLLDARDFDEQKRLLSETPYARHLESANTPAEVERALDSALDGFYRFLDEAALPREVIDFFRARHDFANLKAAAKARLLHASTNGLFVEHGALPPAVFEGDHASLPEPFRSLAATLSAENDVAAIDTAVDVAYFTELGRLARASHSRYLVELAALFVDVANVKTLIRSALAGHPAESIEERLIAGGSVSTERLRHLAGQSPAEIADTVSRLPEFKGLPMSGLVDAVTLDPATDALITAALRRGRRAAAGPEPVIAYVMGREAEVRTLRVLLLGMLTGIDGETLRARVAAAGR